MSHNSADSNIGEPDSVSDGQSNFTADSSDVISSQSQSPSSSDNTSCHSSGVSTSNDGMVLLSQNCSEIRKNFLNVSSDSAGPSFKPNSTSDNVVSTTPKFQLKSSSLGSSLLKPSALSCTSSTSEFSLKAPTLNLNNPFCKKVDLNISKEDAERKSSEEVTSSNQVSDSLSAAQPTCSVSSGKQDLTNAANTTSLPSLPKFVPLLSSTTSSSSVATSNLSSSIGGFVFGQNLRDRVTAVNEEAVNSNTSEVTTAQPSTTAEEAIHSNGSVDEVFTALCPNNSATAAAAATDSKSQKSLSEAAKEYEESRAIKRKYEEVTVVTGEEEECNVLQINCKLFVYDKVKTWIELGRGQLRLNDINNALSRIVIRTAGSLRVILNTKIWAEMVVQKASDNSVRLTALEKGTAKVYLVKAGSKEVDLLYKALEWRVNNQKKILTENGNGGLEEEVECKKQILSSDNDCSPVVTNGESSKQTPSQPETPSAPESTSSTTANIK